MGIQVDWKPISEMPLLFSSYAWLFEPGVNGGNVYPQYVIFPGEVYKRVTHFAPLECPPPPQKPKKYREPVLPADRGKECEFSDDGFLTVEEGNLLGYLDESEDDRFKWLSSGNTFFVSCRIEVTE